MSNSLAIAAVTATLRSLLAAGLVTVADLNDAQVTAQPLDKARDATATVNQVNLFLYLMLPNAAWRSQDMPGRVRPGELASPPLALNLFYLLSAYGRDNDVEAPFSHMLLGQAMSTLYDHPLLGHDEIAAALAGNDLGDQIERVRITLQPLSIDDISKLWAGFQMQYRLSVAYEVAVVLIDTTRPTRAAPPVLARGPGGRGFDATADLLSAYPRLTALTPARPLRLGETVHAAGTGLTGDAVTAQFASTRLANPVQVPATADAAGGFSVAIPAGLGLPAGPSMFSLRFTASGMVRPTNELPLMVAPRIASAMPAHLNLGAGNPSLPLTIEPPVVAGQRVALILGSTEIPAATIAGGQLTFTLTGVTAGTYMARVRVDGVDSLPIVNPDVALPMFDPAQSIVVAA
jgi:Pvc16 N-terminal domain